MHKSFKRYIHLLSTKFYTKRLIIQLHLLGKIIHCYSIGSLLKGKMKIYKTTIFKKKSRRKEGGGGGGSLYDSDYMGLLIDVDPFLR